VLGRSCHVVLPVISEHPVISEQTCGGQPAVDLGECDEDPETITCCARRPFRSRHLERDAGISGGNFISAESGRLVLVTNEAVAASCDHENVVWATGPSEDRRRRADPDRGRPRPGEQIRLCLEEKR